MRLGKLHFYPEDEPDQGKREIRTDLYTCPWYSGNRVCGEHNELGELDGRVIVIFSHSI